MLYMVTFTINIPPNVSTYTIHGSYREGSSKILTPRLELAFSIGLQSSLHRTNGEPERPKESNTWRQCSYGPLPVISTKKIPFIECIIPFITIYNFEWP